MGRNDRPRSHWDTSFTPRIDFDCRLLHQQHISSLFQAFRQWRAVRSKESDEKQRGLNAWNRLTYQKPVLHRINVNEATDKRKLCSSNRHVHDVRLRRGVSTRSQGHPGMVPKKNLSNFIEKTCWPPNSPDINPVENLWSIMDEVVYKDPTPKTMKDLKRRLKQAWKKIPLSTSRYMTFYPTPCRNGLGT